MTESIKKANRLFLAFKDMQDAARYLSAYQKLKEIEDERGSSEYADHREAILMAAIVTYSRPFKCSTTDGNADKRLVPQAIGLFAQHPEFEQLHNTIISRRDKAVAHADWEYHKTELVSMNDIGAVLRRSPRPFYAEGVPIQGFVRLVELVSNTCRNMAFDLDRGSQSGTAP